MDTLKAILITVLVVFAVTLSVVVWYITVGILLVGAIYFIATTYIKATKEL